ncbi:MAG: hypothetical protein WAZ18_00340 [Alphaproteobacteria bacterium]
MAPKNLGSCAHLITVVVVVLSLTLSTLVPQAAVAGGYSGSYESGNPSRGNLGGFIPNYGGESELFSVKSSSGVGANLGCGMMNYMDFVKATFNVSDMADQFKGMMQTFMAKILLTYLMSFPPIAAAYDAINWLADAKAKVFNQSCDIAEARKDGAKLYKGICNDAYSAAKTGDCTNINSVDPMRAIMFCEQALKDGPDVFITRCMANSEPLKPLIAAADKALQQVKEEFFGDPVGCHRGDICDSAEAPGAGSKVVAGCLAMSYMPRICFEANGSLGNKGMGGSKCVGGKRRKPPISMDGVTQAFIQYSMYTMDACGRVWDDIRKADPNMEASTIEKIGTEAIALANTDQLTMSSNQVAPLAQGPLKLAFTDMSLVLKAFGATATNESRNKMLQDYVDNELPGIDLNGPSKELLNPLRMCKFVAEAARAEMALQGKNAQISDPEMGGKVDAAQFFNLPSTGETSDKLAADGLDAQTAALMLEYTFGYIVNVQGGINMTNPVAMSKLALSSGRVWGDWASDRGMDVSCMGMDKILDYLNGVIIKAQTTAGSQNVTSGSTTTKEGADTSTKACNAPIEAVKKQSEKTFDYLEKYFKSLKDKNTLWCSNRPKLQERNRQFFTPENTFAPTRSDAGNL